MILDYFTLLTEVPGEELGRVSDGLQEGGSSAMEAKKRLAREIVGLLHSPTSAVLAQQEFERVFQRREAPEESAIDLAVDLGPSGEAEIDVTQALSQAGVVASRGEARRLVTQGGIAVDGKTLTEARVTLRVGSLIRVGRHRFLRVVAGPVR